MKKMSMVYISFILNVYKGHIIIDVYLHQFAE